MIYLVYFCQRIEYGEFCIGELFQLASNYIDNVKILEKDNFPFVKIDLPNDEIVRQIVDRSILIKYMIKVIFEDKNYDNLQIDQQEQQKYKFIIDQYQSTQKDNINIYNRFYPFFKDSIIDINNYEKIYCIFENHDKKQYKNNILQTQNTLKYIYFGQLVSQRVKDKYNILKYNLKNRLYLGHASTPEILAFIMISYGQVQQNSIVLDPFVGSGGILIAASHKQAICFGAEIDKRILNNQGLGFTNTKSSFYVQDEKIDFYTNFQKYKLQMPELIQMDINNICLRYNYLFDSIICDPPFGWTIKQEGNYNLILKNLFKLSKICLKQNGTLVFLYGVDQKILQFNINDIIQYSEGFLLQHCIENKLNGKSRSRFLIVFKKL